MIGMITSDEISDPATITADCRYPRMYPTASSAGASSSASCPRGSTGSRAEMVAGTRNASATASFTAAPTAIPRKIQALPEPAEVVARSTSAHAVPSG